MAPEEWLRRDFGGLFAVDRPFDAESIDDGAEASGPERLLELCLDRPALREPCKDALGGGGVVHLQGYRKSCGWRVPICRHVRSREGGVADCERRVVDLRAPFLRHLGSPRRFAPCHHEDGAAQTPFVVPECRLAVAVEHQGELRLQFHDRFLAVANATRRAFRPAPAGYGSPRSRSGCAAPFRFPRAWLSSIASRSHGGRVPSGCRGTWPGLLWSPAFRVLELPCRSRAPARPRSIAATRARFRRRDSRRAAATRCRR